MKANHTDITIVLDRSGSMANAANDTIGGFNRFLHDQRQAPGTASLTLHQFDHEFQTTVLAMDVRTAPELTSQTFVPRGNTALLDAIGRAIRDTGSRMLAAGEEYAEKVVFVVITDGQENASREYKPAEVFEMIHHQRHIYKWEFVFLGANQDAIEVATRLGMDSGNALTYAANDAGMAAAFESTSANLAMLRCSDARTMRFSDRDRAAQAAAGAAPAAPVPGATPNGSP